MEFVQGETLKFALGKSSHTALLQVFEEQHKIFLHAAKNTASNHPELYSGFTFLLIYDSPLQSSTQVGIALYSFGYV